uniref:Uncharacterized protein n=2 Tax=Mus musculus TaxID=10090 RepID=Q8BQF7_MOUSE|nr:unnamed protein product [Mus musculus]BAE25689.1 unnamed protein product [Mus musculus]
MASPSLDRWLDSTQLLGSGWPPGLGLCEPPRVPLGRLVPLRGRQAGDRRVRLSEQTVHLGCSRCGVAAHGVPQPIRIPASWFVSPYGIPLGMTCPHQDSQDKWQEAPPTHPSDASGAASGGRRSHGARVAAELWAPETSRGGAFHRSLHRPAWRLAPSRLGDL